MALPIILRNCTRNQALCNLLKTSNNGLSFNTRKSYSGFIANARKNAEFFKQETTNFAVAKRCMSSDHSKLWPIERIITIALLGVTPAAIVTPNLVLDDMLALLSVVHFHWGLEACAVDYIRPILFGNAIPKISLGLVYLLSFATLGGLFYYNHHSLGIGASVRKIWEVKK